MDPVVHFEMPYDNRERMAKFYESAFGWQRLPSTEGGSNHDQVIVACELHRDWRNDIEGLGALFSNHIPNYRNLTTSYLANKQMCPRA
jgi:hypothetical protein